MKYCLSKIVKYKTNVVCKQKSIALMPLFLTTTVKKLKYVKNDM